MKEELFIWFKIISLSIKTGITRPQQPEMVSIIFEIIFFLISVRSTTVVSEIVTIFYNSSNNIYHFSAIYLPYIHHTIIPLAIGFQFLL